METASSASLHESPLVSGSQKELLDKGSIWSDMRSSYAIPKALHAALMDAEGDAIRVILATALEAANKKANKMGRPSIILANPIY
jgi:hypothetical protein